MDPDELDELVQAGHGGAIEDAADAEVDPDAARRAALDARLKCEVIAIVEEAARARGCRVSPLFAQCATEMTSQYARTLSDDLHAFAAHRKSKVVSHEDVLLACRRIRHVRDAVARTVPANLRSARGKQKKLDLRASRRAEEESEDDDE